MKNNLSSANVNRNWSLHTPESLLHAQLENIKELWSKSDVQQFLTSFNPVGVPFLKSFNNKINVTSDIINIAVGISIVSPPYMRGLTAHPAIQLFLNGKVQW